MKKKIAYSLLTFMSLSFLAGCNANGDNSLNDSSSDVSKTYTYREEVSKEPTCEKDGVKSFICNEDASKSYTEKIPALGHLYNVETLDFVWVNYESASVTTDCTRCHETQKFNASITSKVNTEPTCTTPGEKEYTATVTINSETYSDVKKETLTSSHVYTKVDEKSFAPSYATDGKLVECCDKCRDEKETTITKQRDNLDDYGEETNPYLIASLTDWNAFAADAASNTFKDKFVKITNDIGTAEAPIATLVNNNVNCKFAGTVLGNDKTLYVNLSSRPISRTALFAFASNATFKDLTINGMVADEKDNNQRAIASAFLADGSGTITIDNCVNHAEVHTSTNTAAGFVGFLRGGSSLTITNSKNVGTIYASDDYAGGFVGNGKDAKSITLDNCVNEGVISAKENFLDQFIGASKADESVTVNENCKKNGHAYLYSNKTIDETGHYYPCIEEGCTSKFGQTQHNYILVDRVPSTCTKAGTKEHYVCDECDKKFTKVEEQYIIATDESLLLPLAEHTYKLVNEISSTCQSSGTKEHYVCEQCGATFLLKEATYVPVTAEDLVMDKANHVYDDHYESDETGHWQKCTSCDEPSEHEAHIKDYEEATEDHGIKCTVCGYQIAPAKTHEHSYGDVVPEIKSSYVTAGTVSYVPCTSCNAKFNPDTHEELSSEQVTIKAQKEAADPSYGTEENPYLLANSEDFKAFTADVNSGTSFDGKFIKMVADMTEAVTTIIGTSDNPFKGTFDGNGHSIELNINATAENAGMFGYTSGATIKNVVTRGSLRTEVKAKANRAGALVGLATDTQIINCINYADITIGAGIGDVGGIVGVISGTFEISGCKNFGSISADCATAKYVGGIVGDVKGSGPVTNCANGYETLPSGVEQGTIDNIYQYAGGILGGTQAKITISGCTNFMDISSSITGSAGFGGIIGLINMNVIGCSIENSVNKGAINCVSSVGGIVGRLAANSSSSPLVLTNCRNEGIITIGSSVATEDVGVTSASSGTSAKVPGILIGSSSGDARTYTIISE